MNVICSIARYLVMMHQLRVKCVIDLVKAELRAIIPVHLFSVMQESVSHAYSW